MTFNRVRPGAGFGSTLDGADTDGLSPRPVNDRGACAPDAPRDPSSAARGFVIGVFLGSAMWVACILLALVVAW